MKKIILVFGLIFLAGCSSNYSGQPADYRWLGGLGQGFNQAMQYDIELQRANPPQIFYPRQNAWPPPNYWQEELARQQYYENAGRRLKLPGY